MTCCQANSHEADDIGILCRPSFDLLVREEESDLLGEGQVSD